MEQTIVEAEPAIADVRNLSVTFTRGGRDVYALRDVSLSIRPGEILGLVGESGSGKSVLGLTLLGLHGARTTISGTVTVAGADMAHSPDAVRRGVRREHLGAVFQDPMTSLNPTMKIGRQVAEAAGSEQEAERLLGLVGIPDPKSRMGVFPHQLSGGLRQRVMIAMAVAGGPKLIVADEPTTALDVTVQAQVLKLLRSLREEVGCSVLMITHDLGVAAQVADRVAVVYAGRLAEIGTSAEVLQSPAHPYTRGLLRSRLSLESDRTRQLVAMPGDLPSPSAPPAGCAFYSRCDVATDACASTLPEPSAVGAGHLSACLLGPAGGTTNHTIALEPIWQPQHARADAPPVLRMEHLDKSFKIGNGNRLQALRGVDLTIAPGESVALVGESGSGKTTLLRVAAGLETPDNGKVELHSEIRPQMIFQDAGASLTPWLTIEQILGERVRSLGRRQRAGKVADALALVGLPPEAAKAKPYQLSGGQRQRVALARATIVPSKLLLCDEPTSALDVSLAASVINLIGRLRRELDMSVLFVTHDLSVARIVADRIAVMYLGRIVEVGASEQMAAVPTHPYTKALISAVPDVGREPVILAGEPASPLRPPAGCAFHPRCPRALEVCSDTDLDVRLVGSPRDTLHWIACMNPTDAQTWEVA